MSDEKKKYWKKTTAYLILKHTYQMVMVLQ